MRLGIFSKTFEGQTPGLVLQAVAQAGFSAAQYNMACSGMPAMPEHIAPDAAQAVASAARDSCIEITAVSGTYNMVHPDLRVREAGHARLEALAQACAGMGTQLITLCTGTRDPDDQWRAHPDNHGLAAWRDLLQSMEIAVAIAEKYQLYLGIEPELANVVSSAQRARDLMDQLASPRLRIVLDPANLFEVATLDAQRNTVAQAIDLLADRIAMGHAKDRYADGRFATAGQGVLDYPHYLAQLKAVGFDGPLIAHGLAASEAAGVAHFLRSRCDALGIRVRP